MRLMGRLWIAVAVLQLCTPVFADERIEQPSPSALASQRVRSLRSSIWKNRRPICKWFLITHSLLGAGFYLGVRHNAPPTGRVVLTEYEAPLDNPLFAIVEKREVFGVVDQTIIDSRGNPVPGGYNTTSIFSFRGYLFGLNPSGDLFVYRPERKDWITISSHGFKEARAVDGAIVGLTKDGEVFAFTSPIGGKLGFNERTPLVDGQPIEFVSLGKGFTSLRSQTAVDKFQPDTVFAIGEDILMVNKDGTVEVAKKDTAEHRELKSLLDTLERQSH